MKNIIFDFGGVLLNLDYRLTYSRLSEILSIDLLDSPIDENLQKVLDDYEMGIINSETFLWNLQRIAKGKMPQPYELIKAWNAMLLGWNSSRFDFLSDLRKKYQVYLLSNTNELHLEWVMKDLKKNHAIEDFNSRFFEHAFYSHEMGKRKPNHDIYEEVLKTAKIIGSETLFIDDNLQNVIAARRAGLYAVQHNPKNEIIDYLSSYINQFDEEE